MDHKEQVSLEEVHAEHHLEVLRGLKKNQPLGKRNLQLLSISEISLYLGTVAVTRKRRQQLHFRHSSNCPRNDFTY